MPSSYTPNLGAELPADGELDGIWGDVVNANMQIIDRAINGTLTLGLSGTSSTLTTADGALSNGQYKLLQLIGSLAGTHTITLAPNDAQKIYFVRNSTTQSVVIAQGSGSTVTIASGDSAIVYADGGGTGASVANLTDHFAMNSVRITGGTITGITDLAIADGGTGASTATNARINLGLAIGADVQAYDAALQDISGLPTTDGNFIVADGTNWVAESGATARTSLGLGTIATQSAASVAITGGTIAGVAITGGTITGITDLAIADGGTGASTAAGARANLGVAIGTDVQAYDAALQSISGLTTAADQMIYTTAADTYAVTGLTAAGRALLDDADAAAQRTTLGLAIGTDVQAYDADLQAIAGLTVAGVVVRTGAGAAATRSIKGTTAQITVTNGDGVAGDPTVSAVIATKAEAEAGTVNTSLMTPLRVAQAVEAQVTTTQVLTLTAAAAVGAVGTYAFLSPVSTATVYDPGDTLAGASLKYAGAEGGGVSVSATSPSGTWRLMGYKDNTSVVSSLWLRIS